MPSSKAIEEETKETNRKQGCLYTASIFGMNKNIQLP